MLPRPLLTLQPLLVELRVLLAGRAVRLLCCACSWRAGCFFVDFSVGSLAERWEWSAVCALCLISISFATGVCRFSPRLYWAHFHLDLASSVRSYYPTRTACRFENPLRLNFAFTVPGMIQQYEYFFVYVLLSPRRRDTPH